MGLPDQIDASITYIKKLGNQIGEKQNAIGKIKDYAQFIITSD